MRLGLAILVGAAIVGGVVVSCSVDVDLSDKTCPCPSDRVCDPATNRCVTTLPVTAGGSSADGSAPPPAACSDTTCPCTIDADCKDKKRSFCGPAKLCVECLSTPDDTCTAGGYCNDANQCAVGCKSATDCPSGQHCQTASHRCVACTTDGDCAAAGPSKKCSPSGSCVDACAGNGTPCGTGGTCCGGFCLPLTNDVLNCGACGSICSTTNATPTCAASKCTWKCVDGYAHCGAPSANTGCETNLRTVTNCSACGVQCTSTQVVFANGIACASDGCTYSSCQQGHFDFDMDPANGCERACGAKNQPCCPTGSPCNDGNGCKSNGTCPNE